MRGRRKFYESSETLGKLVRESSFLWDWSRHKYLKRFVFGYDFFYKKYKIHKVIFIYIKITFILILLLLYYLYLFIKISFKTKFKKEEFWDDKLKMELERLKRIEDRKIEADKPKVYVRTFK
jgi:hypothetical protein